MTYTPGVNGGRINISVNGGTLMSTGTFVVAGGNNITLSQVGSAMTISGYGPTTLQHWEYPTDGFGALNAVGQGSLSIQRVHVPFFVTGSAAKIGGSLSGGTSTNGSMRTASMSLWMGVYTMNNSTLSLASSGSASQSFGFYGGTTTASTSLYSSINGMRELTVPLTASFIPGEYWIGAAVSSSTVGQAPGFTAYGNTAVVAGASNAWMNPVGSNLSKGAIPYQGIYTAVTSAGPSTIVSAGINNFSASYVEGANFYHAFYNSTY